jgi:L-cysteine S-thiosulfotransferase
MKVDCGFPELHAALFFTIIVKAAHRACCNRRCEMRAKYAMAFLLTSLLALSACDREARVNAKGFRLPDGDAQVGRKVFLYMQCNQCHTIAGMQLPLIPGKKLPYVELGGTVTNVKSYGELVTAIIYPSHELADGYAEEVVSNDGESNMYIYNQHMTVQELIDLVTFLQPQYDVVMPEVTYRGYR